MGKFGWLVELPQQAGVTELNVGCVDCGEFFLGVNCSKVYYYQESDFFTLECVLKKLQQISWAIN